VPVQATDRGRAVACVRTHHSTGSTSLRRSRPRLLVIAAIVASLLATSAEASELGRARERRAHLQQRLDVAATALNELDVELAAIEAERGALQRRLDDLQQQLDAASDRIAGRVRSLYKHGTVDPVTALLGTGDPTAALDRATMVARLVRGDQVASEVAVNARTEVEATVAAIADANAELDAALSRYQELVAQLNADLTEAQAVEARLEEVARERAAEEARRQAAARAAREAERQAAIRAAGGYACPVAQPRSFTNSWGAPRSGGRRHQGIDILAPYGTPVYAIVGGTVDVRSPGRLSGRWIILRGVDGTNYHYMHLQSYTVASGARVSAGAQIATNGDTGNARGTPHVHFEQHPGGGAPVNPYPLLKQICG